MLGKRGFRKMDDRLDGCTRGSVTPRCYLMVSYASTFMLMHPGIYAFPETVTIKRLE